MPVHKIASGRQAKYSPNAEPKQWYHLQYLSLPLPLMPRLLSSADTPLTLSDDAISLLWWWTLWSVVDRITASLRHITRLGLLELDISVIFILRICLIVVSIISLITIESRARSLIANIWWRRSGRMIVVCLVVSWWGLAIGHPACAVHRSSSSLASATIVEAREQEC